MPIGLEKQIFIWVIGGFLAHILLDDLAVPFGLKAYEIFAPNSDIFADSIKQCLAIRRVTAPLLTDPSVQRWPRLFQQYLFHNPYLGPSITVYAQPPLAFLQLMGLARLIVLTNPFAALAAQFICYSAGILGIAIMLHQPGKHRAFSEIWLASLLFISYPALYMLDRGNYHAGYAGLGVIMYLLSGFTGKWRWFGGLALCCAINLRPNIAVLAIAEFIFAENLGAILRNLVFLGVGTALAAGTCLALVEAADPQYTIAAFVHGLAEFRETYLLQDQGVGGNESLYAAARSIWYLFGIEPAYNATIARGISGAGILLAGITLWQGATGRLTKVEGIFLVSTLCVLFSPWNAEYHILKCIAPVFAIAYEARRLGKVVDILSGFQALALLLLLGLLPEFVPNGDMALALILGSVLAGLAVWRSAQEIEGLAATEALVLLTSILAVCPLGGPFSNSIELSVVLISATIIILNESLKRAAVRHFRLAAHALG